MVVVSLVATPKPAGRCTSTHAQELASASYRTRRTSESQARTAGSSATTGRFCAAPTAPAQISLPFTGGYC